MEEKKYADSMLDMYLYESDQLLESLHDIIKAQEQEAYVGETAVQEVFRVLHTIKSSAAIMLYENIAKIAHKLEDVFYYMREAHPDNVPHRELLEKVWKVSDFIASELDKIREGYMPDGDEKALISEIDVFLRKIKSEIQDKGKTLPPENTYVEPSQFYIAPAGRRKKEKPPLTIDLGEHDPVYHPDQGEPRPGDYVIGREEPGKNRIGDKHQAVMSVKVAQLDVLTELADRLSVSGHALSSHPKLEYLGEAKTELCQAAGELENLIAQVQSTIHEMRLVSLNGTFQRMRRLVFSISANLGKEIELRFYGEETEVDRKLSEQITECLIHLVRNAADHGIESAEARKAAGKSTKGKIMLKAEKAGEKVCISVQDDGMGLDPERIFQKAQKSGLTEGKKREAFTEEEIYKFIMCPGISTGEQVTEYSGRGVGMDVVAARVQECGGNLEIRSKAGKGTEMILEFPCR